MLGLPETAERKKEEKIVGVRLMAKEQGGRKLHTCKKKCLLQQGKMCWITLEIHTELLLLHISIISWVLLEFLILNFVPIIGRRLDSTSLYADGLVESCLPLMCFSMIKLERGMLWGILEHATRDSLNPDNKAVSLGRLWGCHTACPMGIST